MFQTGNLLSGHCGKSFLPAVIILLLVGSCFAQPTITLSVSTGPPTTKLLVSGSGYDPYSAVDIFFDTQDKALAVTDGNGAFGQIGITVPGSAKPGTHWLTAVERHAMSSGQIAFTVSTNWPQFHFSASHSGFNPYENVLGTGNVGSLSLLWSYPTNGGSSSPAVADGTVFVGGFFANFYALDANNGTLRWTYSLEGTPGSPAVSEGRVFISSYLYPYYGNSYAIDETTGKLDWKLGDNFYFTNRTASATVEEPLIYYATLGGGQHNLVPGLCTVETHTGFLGPVGYTGNKAYSTPAVVNGVAYYGDKVGYVNAVSGNGLLWQYLTNNDVESSPAVSHGVVFVGSKDKNVYALSAQNGALVWKYTTAGLVQSSPAVANGVLYVGAYRFLYALDARTGSLLWKYPTGAFVQSSPAVANGVVYFGSDDGYLYALDAHTGALLWNYHFGTAVQSSPAVVNGMVYVSTGYHFYAFGLAGSRSETLPEAPDPRTLVPDLQLTAEPD